jgi:hypothetical protein
MGGTGTSANRYQKADVTRDGQNLLLHGERLGSRLRFAERLLERHVVQRHHAGRRVPQYQPASYPTMFCGAYSDSRSKECGLPATLDSMQALRTGWSWAPNGNDSPQYNAAYDIWLGTSNERTASAAT